MYNKEQVYQKREFALLLSFCEEYAVRHAYDHQGVVNGDATEANDEEKEGVGTAEPQRTETRKRSRVQRDADDKPTSSSSSGEAKDQMFTVERLIRIRATGRGDAGKQVLVQWEGYRRPTWEPYDTIQQQLPELLAELEASIVTQLDVVDDGQGDGTKDDSTLRSFLDRFIAEHRIGQSFRWTPDRLNQLEHAAACWAPPIHETADQLRRAIVSLVRSNAQSTEDEPSASPIDAVPRA